MILIIVTSAKAMETIGMWMNMASGYAHAKIVRSIHGKVKMMSDYIKREDAINDIQEWATDLAHPEFIVKEDAVCVLKKLPAADVEPARHGRWEQVDEQPHFRKRFHRMCCSVCRHEGYKSYPYCPNCGAKMDGKEQEHE